MLESSSRREFVLQTAGATVGTALLGSCSRPSTLQAGGDPEWETLLKNLQEQIPQAMKAKKVPGLSLALLRDGQALWTRGFGVKDQASQELVTSDTVFEAASMGKPVFAYRVLKLHELGMLDLDTPLTRYTQRRFLEGDPRLDQITARHVLCHTSGFQNWRSDKEPLKIHFEPGAQHLYSGEGYSYLQAVVAEVTGQPVDPYFRANLFSPFAMDATGYVWNDRFEQHAARPHGPEGQPLNKKKPGPAEAARYAAAGGLHTTPQDYARFLKEVIAPDAGARPDAFRLNDASRGEMLRPQIKLNDEYSSSWALGWRIFPNGSRNFIYHGGENEGFQCAASASLDTRRGFVVMTNGENGAQLLWSLTAELLNPFLAG